MSPFVSFILPAYKGRHLSEAIESILNQTFTDFELVIVNDCSPDDIDRIVALYQDDRIRYYNNEKNIGGENLVKQWNQCLSYAEGEWIVMASDDDIYHPDFLQEMVHLSAKWPQNDVFHCNILTIDDDNNVTDVSPQISEHETGLQNLYYRLTNSRIEALQDYFIRKAKLLEIGGFIDFPTATGSDLATCITIASHNGIICSSKYLFKWRNNSDNISSNPKTSLQRIYACEKIFDWVIEQQKQYSNYNDDVSIWINNLFLPRVKQYMIWSEQYLIQIMPINDLKKIIDTNPWPFKLVDRKYAKRNRLIRIKNVVLQKEKSI